MKQIENMYIFRVVSVALPLQSGLVLRKLRTRSATNTKNKSILVKTFKAHSIMEMKNNFFFLLDTLKMQGFHADRVKGKGHIRVSLPSTHTKL
jgi:hypothetical protein